MKAQDFKSDDVRYYALPMVGPAVVDLIGIALMAHKAAL